MTSLKQLAAVAALALVGLTSAHADGVTYVPMDPGSPGQFTNTFSFSSVGDANGAGATFDDYFVFNVPDTEVISFTAQSNGVGALFEGYALYDGVIGDLLTVNDSGSASALSLTAGGWTLTSGTYTLELAGEFNVAGGSYSGFLEGNPPSAVPEPSGLALMLAGLGAVGALARRRSKKA